MRKWNVMVPGEMNNNIAIEGRRGLTNHRDDLGMMIATTNVDQRCRKYNGNY